MDYDSYDAILHWLFRTTQGDAWFKPSEENVSSGICLRVETGQFRVFPYENLQLAPFEAAVRLLNPLVAIKVRSAAVHAALATVQDDAIALYLDASTRIQILDTMPHLPKAEKEQRGAFIRDERVLVVWSDDLDTIVAQCNEFDEKLMKLVWRSRPTLSTASTNFSLTSSRAASDSELNPRERHDQNVDEKAQDNLAAKSKPKKARQCKWLSWKLSSTGSAEKDPEKAQGLSPRPIRLFAPVYGGLGAALSTFFILSGVSTLLAEWRLDDDYTRFALLVTAPFLFCVSIFFSLQIITNLSFLQVLYSLCGNLVFKSLLRIGPVAQFHENSRYYSAVPPQEEDHAQFSLPHITIEMPVYKESLEETIAPSVFSLKKAMQTYARQGGTCAIFIHEDGLQSLSPEERDKRISFYANHNIGWVARPPHSNSPDGFQRAGRFKKASNMNYGLALSLVMEKHIVALEAAAEGEDDPDLENKALELAIQETFEKTGNKWKPWASNARSLRLGEIILIVDSDTIVPEDCLRDAAREMAECPEVAILQHESDVMQVAHHYFENGISHFTRRINKCISMACANGEVAPFVGHNAFLRWSALQDAAFVDPIDGVKKIWSETNVSEDFDMALRLQLKGYIIRWATYSKGGFKEGVSLTADDELNRWQKYSYGCNELIFNPLIRWWRRGPINKQLRTFLWSSAPVHYKISMMAYMFSYYGIAASTVLALMNYFILGWAVEIDGYYLHSFEIWLACTVVFPGAGNVAFTLLEYRLGTRSLFSSLIENVTWIPFFFFFFGGLSIHLSTALLSHLFSYNMTWGATKKEVERSNFWIEVPRIWKRFWFAFVISFASVAMMIVLSTPSMPYEWQVPGYSWACILPLAIVAGSHILFPILLNPWLMIFSY
ncbi:hypothetical protein FISHEDRAFT_53946 [Fistulina hepatica ATCC 64428]|uniref:Uncharacterized protein n=1 Tax=Fistulina hepatica ATCC 64428 TaxID=1128425 RepID=A0A0D7A2Q4_9AGAR|nr:hypothetical protein FISHEDRAFT_53946 [Fistulina hepatica ATCC 64428]